MMYPPYILIRAVSQGPITKERAKQAINEMVFAGWRCSVETYAKIMDGILCIVNLIKPCNHPDKSLIKKSQNYGTSLNKEYGAGEGISAPIY